MATAEVMRALVLPLPSVMRDVSAARAARALERVEGGRPRLLPTASLALRGKQYL